MMLYLMEKTVQSNYHDDHRATANASTWKYSAVNPDMRQLKIELLRLYYHQKQYGLNTIMYRFLQSLLIIANTRRVSKLKKTEHAAMTDVNFGTWLFDKYFIRSLLEIQSTKDISKPVISSTVSCRCILSHYAKPI